MRYLVVQIMRRLYHCTAIWQVIFLFGNSESYWQKAVSLGIRRHNSISIFRTSTLTLTLNIIANQPSKFEKTSKKLFINWKICRSLQSIMIRAMDMVIKIRKKAPQDILIGGFGIFPMNFFFGLNRSHFDLKIWKYYVCLLFFFS